MRRNDRIHEAVLRLEGALASHGGVATPGQLRAAGVRRTALTHGMARGSVERVARGLYSLGSTPPPVQAAQACHGVRSHTTAATQWCLDQVARSGPIDITVPRNARRPPARGVRLHWAGLDPDDIVGERIGGMTGVVRTVLDCARALPFPEALAIADSAIRSRACTSDELGSRAAALRGAGSARVRRVVQLADGRADNPMESVLRAVVVGTGVGGFEPQLQIDEDGRQARVDLGDRRRRIVLEADSFMFHGSRAAVDHDCRRYSDLVAADWSVLRFSWEQVMFDREWMAARVTALVSLADARRAPRMPRRRPA